MLAVCRSSGAFPESAAIERSTYLLQPVAQNAVLICSDPIKAYRVGEVTISDFGIISENIISMRANG